MMKTAGYLFVAATLLVSQAAVAEHEPQNANDASEACAADGDLNFVCGPPNVEDLVVIPGTHWIVASDLGNPVGSGHGLNLIDTDQKTWQRVTLDAAAAADPAYAGCSALGWSEYSFHGLSASHVGDDVSRLYAVNHGVRESIEIFEVTSDQTTPSLRWVGCVFMPDGAMGNAVAGTPDGGFVTTKFGQAGDAEFMAKLAAGEQTGTALRWSPDEGYTDLEQPMSGANGIEVSEDGRWAFVSAWSEHKVIRLDLTGQSLPVAMETDFLPDNLHWDTRGQLLVVGQTESVANLMACRSPECGGWKAISIDPETMQSQTLLMEDGREHFAGASAAVEIDDVFWIGTPDGDRVAYIPRPHHEGETEER